MLWNSKAHIPCVLKCESFEGEKRHWMNKDYIFFLLERIVENGRIIEHTPKVILQDILLEIFQ